MADRHILHKSKLKDFEKWLENQGYTILPTSKNIFEVLRAKKEKNTVIIYSRNDSKEHLTITDKDYPIVRKFIRDKANVMSNMKDLDVRR